MTDVPGVVAAVSLSTAVTPLLVPPEKESHSHTPAWRPQRPSARPPPTPKAPLRTAYQPTVERPHRRRHPTHPLMSSALTHRDNEDAHPTRHDSLMATNRVTSRRSVCRRLHYRHHPQAPIPPPIQPPQHRSTRRRCECHNTRRPSIAEVLRRGAYGFLPIIVVDVVNAQRRRSLERTRL